ncbi:MAG: hypothetical protein ACI4J4_08010, partial [Ruminiclostridium sp.]
MLFCFCGGSAKPLPLCKKFSRKTANVHQNVLHKSKALIKLQSGQAPLRLPPGYVQKSTIFEPVGMRYG